MQVDTKIPATSQEILREADKLGFKYKFNGTFDVGQIDPERRVQVRTENVAPQENVRSYATQLKAGVVFPPIILSLDGYIVDGNTRAKAFKAAKIPHAPIIVIQANYEPANADPVTKAKFNILAAAANQKGAQRLKAKEAKLAAEEALRLGFSNKRIMETTGVSNSAINRLRRQEAARERLHQIGMQPERVEVLDILGSPEVLALNNDPYKRLTLLVKDAGLSARETREIAKGLKKDGSDVVAIERLQQYRAEMDDRIRQHAMTGNGRPPQSARLRQALGIILSFEDKGDAVVERNPALCEEQARKINAVLEYLDGLLALQEAWNKTGAPGTPDAEVCDDDEV